MVQPVPDPCLSFTKIPVLKTYIQKFLEVSCMSNTLLPDVHGSLERDIPGNVSLVHHEVAVPVLQPQVVVALPLEDLPAVAGGCSGEAGGCEEEAPAVHVEGVGCGLRPVSQLSNTPAAVDCWHENTETYFLQWSAPLLPRCCNRCHSTRAVNEPSRSFHRTRRRPLPGESRKITKPPFGYDLCVAIMSMYLLCLNSH